MDELGLDKDTRVFGYQCVLDMDEEAFCEFIRPLFMMERFTFSLMLIILVLYFSLLSKHPVCDIPYMHFYTHLRHF